MTHNNHSGYLASISINSYFALMLLGASFSLPASEDVAWNNEQMAIIKVMGQLSQTTALDGAGADAYGEFLAEDFGRWTVGSKLINGKKAWLDGIRGWFDDGWRVEGRENSVLEIIIAGEYAFTRRTVHERYLGPDGDRSQSSAALAEVWIRQGDRWLLQQVNVHPES